MRKFSASLGAAALAFVAAMTTLAQSAPPADASGGPVLGGYNEKRVPGATTSGRTARVIAATRIGRGV